MKTYRGVEVWFDASLISALNGGEQLHAPAFSPPGERTTGSYWIGGWVDPKADLGMDCFRWYEESLSLT
jgi:hypothetical protein